MAINEKINYYLDIAQEVMELGTCLRHNSGAIIVSHDLIISTGYSHIVRQDGAHWGREKNIYLNCRIPEKLQMSKGECYEHCRVAHTEIAAITDTPPRELMRGATLYLVGRDMQSGELASHLHAALRNMLALHHQSWNRLGGLRITMLSMWGWTVPKKATP